MCFKPTGQRQMVMMMMMMMSADENSKPNLDLTEGDFNEILGQ